MSADDKKEGPRGDMGEPADVDEETGEETGEASDAGIEVETKVEAPRADQG